MSRTAPMIGRELWQLGYDDQKNGMQNAKLIADYTWNGRAYREGRRARRRDEFDGEALRNEFGQFAYAPPIADYCPSPAPETPAKPAEPQLELFN